MVPRISPRKANMMSRTSSRREIREFCIMYRPTLIMPRNAGKKVCVKFNSRNHTHLLDQSGVTARMSRIFGKPQVPWLDNLMNSFGEVCFIFSRDAVPDSSFRKPVHGRLLFSRYLYFCETLYTSGLILRLCAQAKWSAPVK